MAVKLLCLVVFFIGQVTEDDVKIFFQRLCGKVYAIQVMGVVYISRRPFRKTC
jgi:hypothetical protein